MSCDNNGDACEIGVLTGDGRFFSLADAGIVSIAFLPAWP